MNQKGYAWGLPALAWAIIILLVIILIVTFVPPVKETVMQIIGAIFK
jgi:hypothetical protein